MAGGIGSRFWPMSRTDFPKQFLDILGTGKTLIQQTFERYKKLVPAENIYIVTAQEYVDIVKTQLPEVAAELTVGSAGQQRVVGTVVNAAFVELGKLWLLVVLQAQDAESESLMLDGAAVKVVIPAD